MKQSFFSAWVLACGLLCALLWQSGCGDPLVSLECASGYSICKGKCVDLKSDELSCGSCGSSCASDEMCIAAECTTDFDGGGIPGGADGGSPGGGDGGADGGLDAGLDGSADGSTRRDGGDAASEGIPDATGGDGSSGPGDGGSTGFPDVELPPLCTGAGSPSNCVCELGELICQSSCVNANIDLVNCGACGNNCNAVPPVSGTYFCIQGTCVLNCATPLSVCGNACIDLQTDPNNCGSCGFSCESGLCDLGQCLDRTAGHVIVIGHDMSSALPATKRLAGNAIFLPSKQRVRVLVYEGQSLPSARAGVVSAIAEVQGVTGRMFQRTEATDPAAVSLQLSQADVFVIVSQANSSNAELEANGDLWARAMQTFIARGGVIVLFDGGGAHDGTYQILEEAGLFTAVRRVDLTPRTVNIEAPGDALASFVSAVYQAQNTTVGFETTDTTVVVRDRASTWPIVIHIAR